MKLQLKTKNSENWKQCYSKTRLSRSILAKNKWCCATVFPTRTKNGFSNDFVRFFFFFSAAIEKELQETSSFFDFSYGNQESGTTTLKREETKTKLGKTFKKTSFGKRRDAKGELESLFLSVHHFLVLWKLLFFAIVWVTLLVYNQDFAILRILQFRTSHIVEQI